MEVSRLEEQGWRDQERLVSVEREAVEARRGKEELETVVETLRQQNRDLQIEKDTEVAITYASFFLLWCPRWRALENK